MRWLVLAGAVAAALVVLGVALAGRGPERAACGKVGDRERVVSPDGARSAFVRCTKDGSAWLYVARGHGADAHRLVPRRYNCCYRPSTSVVFREPVWSPDARRIAVVIADVGGTDVWVIEASGRSARRVTSGPGVERSPSWSADGTRVAFRTEMGGTASAPAPRS